MSFQKVLRCIEALIIWRICAKWLPFMSNFEFLWFWCYSHQASYLENQKINKNFNQWFRSRTFHMISYKIYSIDKFNLQIDIYNFSSKHFTSQTKCLGDFEIFGISCGLAGPLLSVMGITYFPSFYILPESM